MPQHTAGAARPTPVAVVNGVAEKADLSLQCHFGHGREPAAAPRLPTPRERAVARWNALVHAQSKSRLLRVWLRTCLLLCARSPLLCVRTALLCVLNGLFFG